MLTQTIVKWSDTVLLAPTPIKQTTVNSLAGEIKEKMQIWDRIVRNICNTWSMVIHPILHIIQCLFKNTFQVKMNEERGEAEARHHHLSTSQISTLYISSTAQNLLIWKIKIFEYDSSFHFKMVNRRSGFGKDSNVWGLFSTFSAVGDAFFGRKKRKV